MIVDINKMSLESLKEIVRAKEAEQKKKEKTTPWEVLFCHGWSNSNTFPDNTILKGERHNKLTLLSEGENGFQYAVDKADSRPLLYRRPKQ